MAYRRWIGRLIAILAIVVLGSATLVMAARSKVIDGATAARWNGSIERIMIAAGLGLDMVTVSGQRYTSDSDVFDCLDLPNVRTLAALQSLRAKTCIEQLPWVGQAAVSRVYPGRLDIALTERVPFAVWHHAGRAVLVDATGRTLSAVSPDHTLAHLKIAGEGAPQAAPILVETLKHVPAIGRRLEKATRVTGRRWSLQLSGNIRIELPPEGEATALAALLHHSAGPQLLTAGNVMIDLRSRFEMATRPLPALSSSEGG